MKQIPDFNGYYASEDGNIWCDLGKGRRDRKKRTEPYQLTPRPGKSGYSRVYLRRTSTGKRQDVYVHRIIASMFCSNPDGLSDVNHKDFNRANNAADNLEWVSHRDNLRYTEEHGRRGRDALGSFTSV